jgi:aminoglycoside 6-adenylyltransferase
MENHWDEKEVTSHLVRWAEQQLLVRAMILTSTRAIPGGVMDIFSDYDVILVLRDILPFHNERGWLEAFGQVLALYRDPLQIYLGHQMSGYVIQFESGLKIDFTLWPVPVLQQIIEAPELPDEMDAGYRVLLDKDKLTEGLKQPTYQAYIPKPPSETAYREAIEVFFLDVVYTAKYLWRDDVMAAKFILDNFIKHEHIRPVLEWHIEIHNQWSVKPGPYGRRIKKWLRPDLWADLERTYTGARIEDNWTALYNSIALMRKVAQEVGEHLGYAYPNDIDQKTAAYIEKIKNQEIAAGNL